MAKENYNATGLTIKDAIQVLLDNDLTELFNVMNEVIAARDGETSLLVKEQAQDTAAQTVTDEVIAARDGETSLLVKEQAQDTEIVALKSQVSIGEKNNYYFPDPLEIDQGANGNGFSIKDCIDATGSKRATIFLKHNSIADITVYTVSTDLTIPENVCFIIENGAIVSVDDGNTLTINGAFEAGLYQVFSGDGNIKGVGLREVNILWLGAKGDGVTNDSPAFQKALNIAQGEDGDGVGREGFKIIIPAPFVTYLIKTSLIINGTSGVIIKGPGGHFIQRQTSINNYCHLTWGGTLSLPVIQIKGDSGISSNPNSNIIIKNLSISGFQTGIHAPTAPEANVALAGIYIGNLDGIASASLLRNAVISNCYITNCRFGIYSGSPEGQNTDHATIMIRENYIYNNFQHGIFWGTGNAIGHIISNHISANGWYGADYIADDYSINKGTNIYIQSGYVDILSNTSAGAGDNKPDTADIYQENGRVSIVNAWSDTHGYFFYQAAVTKISDAGRQTAQITGVRHWEGSMDINNTPDSIRIVAPGTSIISCSFYGNIRIDSDFGGSPILLGIQFGRDDATYIGSGVNTQHSLTILGNVGNSGQILLGGAEAGVPLKQQGSLIPQILSMGTSKSGQGPIEAIVQFLGTAIEDSGITVYYNADGGTLYILINAYVSGAGYIPQQTNHLCWLISMGGRSFEIKVYDPNGSSAVFTSADFISLGGLITPPFAGYRAESAYFFPKRADAPSFTSGDFWKGSVYYNTTTNKLQLNTGGSTWVSLN